MTGTEPKVKYRIEKQAPEGGWGYLVGIGITLPFACGIGSLHSFGLMFNDFLADSGAEASAVTVVTGVFFSALSFAGLCASPLIRKFSLRSIGLLGASIYFGGSLMTIFITSVKMLIISFGLLQGFEKEMTEDEIKLTVVPEDQDAEGITENETRHIELNTIENGNNRNNGRTISKKERSKSLADPSQLEQFGSLQKRMESIVSINDLGCDVVTRRPSKSPKSGFWAKFVDYLDLTLLKDLVYVNIVIGVSSGLFSDNIFSSLLPMYLKSLGFSIDDAALVVSIGTAADMISRFVVAFVALFFAIRARYLFLIGAIALIIVRFVFLHVFSLVGMFVIVAFIGFFRTWLHLPMALIFAEYLPGERFASGYGLFTFIQGNFTFLMGPICGWIRDATQSYVVFTHSIQFFMAICVVPWIIEIIWFRPKVEKDTK